MKTKDVIEYWVNLPCVDDLYNDAESEIKVLRKRIDTLNNLIESLIENTQNSCNDLVRESEYSSHLTDFIILTLDHYRGR